MRTAAVKGSPKYPLQRYGYGLARPLGLNLNTNSLSLWQKQKNSAPAKKIDL